MLRSSSRNGGGGVAGVKHSGNGHASRGDDSVLDALVESRVSVFQGPLVRVLELTSEGVVSDFLNALGESTVHLCFLMSDMAHALRVATHFANTPSYEEHVKRKLEKLRLPVSHVPLDIVLTPSEVIGLAKRDNTDRPRLMDDQVKKLRTIGTAIQSSAEPLQCLESHLSEIAKIFNATGAIIFGIEGWRRHTKNNWLELTGPITFQNADPLSRRA